MWVARCRAFRSIWVLVTCVTLCFVQQSNAKFIDNLSYDDLSSTLRGGPTLMIFTVTWCPHCKEVLPEIGVLAKAVKNNDALTVARVDADAEPAIVSKFNVESFPTFLYFPPSFNMKDGKEPEEFTDYRWAELMAEFVNNETQSETVKLEPRQKFLNWRQQVPFNKGKQPRQRHIEAPTPTPHPEGLDPIIGADEGDLKIRDPILLSKQNFDDVVMIKTEAVVVYFYTKDDFMQKEFLIEWRQASSAYSPEDRVSLAMMNIGREGNDEIANKYNVTDTPSVAYFQRCDSRKKELPIDECKKPRFCDSCTDTDSIIDFISNQMMVEMGLDPNAEPGEQSEDIVTLTTEEYEQMIKEGKIKPIDPNNPDEFEGTKVEHVEDHETTEHVDDDGGASSKETSDASDAKDEL